MTTMNVPTKAAYETALRALAAYKTFSAPYVQRNGWTVIPADAPRPIFEGAELTGERVNAFSTTVELFELDRDKPARFSAYVQFPRANVTTWTGEEIGLVCSKGAWHRNNFGGKFRSLRVRAAWGDVYHGREYDSRQLVNLTRCAA